MKHITGAKICGKLTIFILMGEGTEFHPVFFLSEMEIPGLRTW